MDSLSVPGTLQSLGEIRGYVDAAAAAARLEKHQAYSLRLAVDEVATNIVVHGYEENGLTGRIVVRASVDDAAVAVTVEDSGPPFDPRSRVLPDAADLAKPLEDRDVGGLGLYLAFKRVDEFRYERRDDKNFNTFIMRRVHGAAEPA